MITDMATVYGQTVVLKFAHKDPTARDLRDMAYLLRVKADNCDREAKKLEDASEYRKRVKEAFLP